MQKIIQKKAVVLFHFPWETLMEVTHHNCPSQFVGINKFR
jgi:hypothetical protein